MAVVLKISCQGHTHRVPFDSLPGYAALEAAMKAVLPACKSYSAKYKDDEGDLCTLVEPTFPDFLTTGKGTPAGQTSFRVEVVPLFEPKPAVSSPIPPRHSLRKFPARRQEQPAKAVWVDDRRDLDKLVQQFADEPALPKKKHRKKSKKTSATGEAPEEAQEESAESAVDDAASESAFAAGDTTTADMPEDNLQTEKDAVHHDPPAREQHARPGPECKDEEWETDDEAFWDMRTSSSVETDPLDWDFEPAKSRNGSARRSSSCPCLPTYRASHTEAGGPQAASLVAQAWPFVDVPVSNLSSSPLVTGFGGRDEGAQEVVWMPVYINWWTADSSIAIW